ncbi:hypothetical protein ACFYTQ_13945 [Nocardia sp. NPDC004068]|uniref:hypothetical protein n=1 Tax=Nocardia sp. NPDC004068 TaxID=3364303 RepID=UPI0036C184C2
MRRKNPGIRSIWLIGLLAATVAGMTACSGTGNGGEPRPGSTPADNRDAIVAEATAFGGIVLPEGVSVLDARTERGADTLYQLALSTTPEGVDQLLRSSNFSAPLVKVFQVAEPTIAGPPLNTSPSILRAEDEHRGTDGKTVFRVIVVDERDQTSRYLHIQLFTT